jgi:hypothetical protein
MCMSVPAVDAELLAYGLPCCEDIYRLRNLTLARCAPYKTFWG